MWTIYNQPKLTVLPSSVTAEYWILVLSAASLVIGLATFGKRVTRVVGKEIATVRPTRQSPLSSHPSAVRRPCVEHSL